MSPEAPGPFDPELGKREAFEPVNEGYKISSSTFSSILSAAHVSQETYRYTLSVRVPTLAAATSDEVGTAVVSEWFRTLEIRLADAPKSTRIEVDLVSCTVERGKDEVLVEYIFECNSGERAADIAKAFAEYVEGTYVESIIPGYEYQSPVSTLLSQASQGEKGGTPL